MEQAQIYLVELLESPKTGQYFPINQLPPNLMKSQTAFIKLAAKKYKKLSL